MFIRLPGTGANAAATMAAIGKSLATIEFMPDGRIITANENFCRVMGYSLEEIKGKHHSMFVESEYASGAEYRNFWDKLSRGEFDAREYKRIAKGGREVWIQASYNPVVGLGGKVSKVVKVATDITASKVANAEVVGKLDAISRVQAIIEFTTDGKIITANENFLNTLGYRLDEIKGQHHRMFVEPAYAQSRQYHEFWAKLNRGEFIAEEFKRVGKGGKEVWIQASYNPIFDLNRNVVKVVKFAVDIGDRVRAVREIGEGLHQLAGGNLEWRLPHPFSAQFEKLRADYNSALEALEDAMLQVQANVLGIRGGTHEIRTASDQMAQRTEQQAANLEETAAAVDFLLLCSNGCFGSPRRPCRRSSASPDTLKCTLAARIRTSTVRSQSSSSTFSTLTQAHKA